MLFRSALVFSVFATKSFWSGSQKLLHVAAGSGANDYGCLLAGPRAGNLSSGSITLQWVWLMLDDTVFELFLDQKKTIFASNISGNRDTEPLPMNRDFS